MTRSERTTSAVTAIVTATGAWTAQRSVRWDDYLLVRTLVPADPLWEVLNDGGPYHPTEVLDRYLERLRETARGDHAEALAETEGFVPQQIRRDPGVTESSMYYREYRWIYSPPRSKQMSMERGLVLLRETDRAEQLLEEAGEYADGTGARLLLLSFMSEQEYENDAEALASIGAVEDVSYDEDAILGGVEQEIEESAATAFEGRSVEHDSIVVVAEEDEHADRALEAADRHGCDHLFVVGQKRSPTGKALFGDTVQQLILNFDGYVTVTME